jgi:hypothetical protein
VDGFPPFLTIVVDAMVFQSVTTFWPLRRAVESNWTTANTEYMRKVFTNFLLSSWAGRRKRSKACGQKPPLVTQGANWA